MLREDIADALPGRCLDFAVGVGEGKLEPAGKDPQTVMRELMRERYPVYGEADITVVSRDVPHEVIVEEILERLREVVKSSAGLEKTQ